MSQSRKTDTDVLIVGAGPTGLTMACELRRRGIDCRVIDKAEAPSPTSRALAVHARTLEVFDDMGIAELLLKRGVRITGANVYEGQNQLLHLRFQQIETPFPYVLSVPQSETERVLIERLHSLGREVERSKELTDLHLEETGVVAMVKRAGQDTHKEMRARWLIGCDGASSQTRTALGIEFVGSTYEEDFMLADVRLNWKKGRDKGYMWLHEDGLFLAVPLSHQDWRLIANIAEGAEQETEPSVERFQQLLLERTGEAATISDPTWLSNFKIHRRLVTHYRRGRILLAGDAAHVHSPVGGQGMNIGIRDAYNLAWKLALVVQSQAPSSLLDTYEEERRPVAEAIMTGTHVSTRLIVAQNPALQFVRDRLLTQLLSLDFIQPLLVNRAAGLDIDYRKSSLSKESYGSWSETTLRPDQESETPSLKDRFDFQLAPRAGDRAPEGPCLRHPSRSQTSLFQALRGTHFTLLLFGGLAATKAGLEHLIQVADWLDSRLGNQVRSHLIVANDDDTAVLTWQGSILFDPEHELHRTYGAGAESLYFIRPDGYIGFRSQPVDWETFLRYLSLLFRPDWL